MTNARNSQRWAIDQRNKARAAFTSTPAASPAEQLVTLRAMADMMRAIPSMATTLAAVEAEIAKLEQRNAG